MTVLAPRRVYGGFAYGTAGYGGLISATIVPTRNVDGIIFLSSNDRYQVVSCSYGGTFSVAPEFRYWYANPAPWEEEVAQDGYIPPYYAEDEDGTIPVGSLELPFRKFSKNQEGQINGVIVEFMPRPSSLLEDDLTAGSDITFSVRTEAQGVPGLNQTGIGGTLISATKSFSEDMADQGSTVWPNIRTEFFPCRIEGKVLAARVVLSNIRLCKIMGVHVIGGTLPGRTT